MTRDEAETWRDHHRATTDRWTAAGLPRTGLSLRMRDGRDLHTAADSLESAVEIAAGILAAGPWGNQCRACGGRGESRLAVDGQIVTLCGQCGSAALYRFLDGLPTAQRGAWLQALGAPEGRPNGS